MLGIAPREKRGFQWNCVNGLMGKEASTAEGLGAWPFNKLSVGLPVLREQVEKLAASVRT